MSRKRMSPATSGKWRKLTEEKRLLIDKRNINRNDLHLELIGRYVRAEYEDASGNGAMKGSLEKKDGTFGKPNLVLHPNEYRNVSYVSSAPGV